AAERHPDRVTVMSIDQLIRDDADLSGLLHGLGYRGASARRISQSMRETWRPDVSFPWVLLFRAAAGIVLVKGAGRNDLRPLLSHSQMTRKLQAVTHRVSSSASIS